MVDVFISYSRKDTDFVQRLFDALEKQKHPSWVDWKGIDYSTKWWEEICAGIDRANNFVFIISPDSLDSKYCHNEITHARNHNKRIIPFVYIPIDDEKWQRQPLTEQALDNWKYLKSLQFISYPKLNDFDQALAKLIETVDKDPKHVQTHTELLAAAKAWMEAGKSPGFLLRDERLISAEEWLQQAQEKEPMPTAGQRDFVSASRKLADSNRARIRQIIGATVVLVSMVIILAMASLVFSGQAASANNEAATANAARTEAFGAQQTSIAQVGTATVEQGNAQNAASTATVAQGAAQKRVEIAEITLTSVPPVLTAVASALADARAEQDIGISMANASIANTGNLSSEALQIVNALVDAYPDKALAYVSRGLIYVDSKQPEKALEDFDKAIELDPNNASFYFNRAIAYRDLQEYEQAIVDLDKAIELDPTFAIAYSNRADVYKSMKQYDKALLDYARSIELDPKRAVSYIGRGNTYNRLEEYGKAIADFDHAIEIDPDSAAAYSNRGNAYRGINVYTKAIADFDHAIELDPTLAEVYFNRGVAYSSIGQLDKAIADLTTVLRFEPDVADNYLVRGYFYNRHNQYTEALADWGQYEALGGSLSPELEQIRLHMQDVLNRTPTPTATS